MATESPSLWIPFFALLAYAVACQAVLVARLMHARVPVPWFFLSVPLHLFQRCREYQSSVGPKLQWWALSVDFAVLACLGIFVVIHFRSS